MSNAKIIITFDQHNLPQVKMKNTTRTQIFDASVFLNGVSREKPHRLNRGKKSQHKFARFIKRLFSATKPINGKYSRNEIVVPFPLLSGE